MANVTCGCCWGSGRGQLGWRGCWHLPEVADAGRAALYLQGLPPQLLLHPKPQGLTGLLLLSVSQGMYPAYGFTPQHLHPKLLWCSGSPHGAPNLPPGKPYSARFICPHPWFQPLPTLYLMPSETLLVLPFTQCVIAPLPPAF